MLWSIPGLVWALDPFHSGGSLRQHRGSVLAGSTWHHRNKQQVTRAPSQHPKRRPPARPRKASKPRDRYPKSSYRTAIWQAHRQHCCRSACQISERSNNSKYKSRGPETPRDPKERRTLGHWDGAQSPIQNNQWYQNKSKHGRLHTLNESTCLQKT